MSNQLDLTIQTIDGTQVVSSIDLARTCIGRDKYDHKNFMAKAKKVLGKDVVNFYHREKYGNNNERTILLLPKREACLMAMSYSYELQAQVFDAWVAAEGKVIEQQQTINNLELMAKQNMLNHLTIDVEIDELTKKKTLTEIKYQMEVAKALGKSFDINQYIANASLTPDETKHLASVKGMIGSTIKELGGIEKPYDTVSTLLAKHGSIIRPKVFNDYLEVLNVISQRTVTEYGKRWGFNFKSGKSIQPRWYEETFPELINMVNQETYK